MSTIVVRLGIDTIEKLKQIDSIPNTAITKLLNNVTNVTTKDDTNTKLDHILNELQLIKDEIRNLKSY